MNLPPAVRILPMSRKEFGGKKATAVQRDFFSRDLLETGGRYRFYERGLDAVAGTVVLFQYDNAVVASATLIDVTRFRRPDEDGCSGCFNFDPSTVRVFRLMGPAQMRKVWPGFESFGQVRQDLPPGRYSAFLRATLDGATIAASILRAVNRVIGGDRTKVFTRADVRVAANVDRDWWTLSWNPIFQGMRVDHPGKAPVQAKKHRNVLKRVAYGQFTVTAYGWSLVRSTAPDEDGRHSTDLRKIEAALDENDSFDPKDQSDERERTLVQIAQRRGYLFRRKLLAAYDGRCAVTGCDAKPALEAAHILAYAGDKSDFVSNGLLLRGDIHTLFDLDLIGINPRTLAIALARSLRGTTYDELAGKVISLPNAEGKRPNPAALKRRWREFQQGR